MRLSAAYVLLESFDYLGNEPAGVRNSNCFDVISKLAKPHLVPASLKEKGEYPGEELDLSPLPRIEEVELRLMPCVEVRALSRRRDVAKVILHARPVLVDDCEQRLAVLVAELFEHEIEIEVDVAEVVLLLVVVPPLVELRYRRRFEISRNAGVECRVLDTYLKLVPQRFSHLPLFMALWRVKP